LAQVLPERPVAVCRELTKAFEEVVRGTPGEVAGRFENPPKGEITLVLGPTAAGGTEDEGEALSAVAELVAAGLPRKQAADVVARLTGHPRNVLYRSTL
jgi:16S rRNA (cytidine1402-2'-O)-methyltransferase